MRPARIVVDDAHLQDEDRIPELRKLRREMDADFRIVAVTWPGRNDAVAGLLDAATQVTLEELERDQILAIVEEAGVAGPLDLQRYIVHQAHGRAGLAVALARACVAGHAGEVATGEALLTDLVGWYERVLGKESRYILGALALAGDTGATIEQAREIAGLGRSSASALVRGMAQGGTIDEVRAPAGARMRVQPEALRYALVRDVFFGGPGAIDAEAAMKSLDHPSIAALPIIGAKHRGAEVLPTVLLPLIDWEDERTVTAYARLGSIEFRTAIERSRGHQVAIAKAALEAGIEGERALEVLMHEAVDEHRSEHNSPDHPLRVVGDHLAEFETGIGGRKLAVKVAKAWLESGGESSVGARVLMHAAHPEIRESSLDAGLGVILSLREGAVPHQWIADLAGLWDEILNFAESYANVPPAPLIEGLQAWLYPEQIGFGQGPDTATSEAIRAVGAHVAERLTYIYADHPGVLHRLQAEADRADLTIEASVSDEFATLFPTPKWVSDREGEYTAWELRASARVESLAKQWAPQSSDEIAAFVCDIEQRATEAGITHPRLTPMFVRILAEEAAEPEGLLVALSQRNAPGDLLLLCLDRAATLQRPGWETLIEQYLGEPDKSWIAARVALKRPCEARLKRLAVENAAMWLPLIEELIVKNEIDHETLALLFEAREQAVRECAAITLGAWRAETRLAELPVPLQTRWREIIVDSAGDAVLFADILKRDHELCADWLRAWFDRISKPGHYEFVREGIAEAISGMPVATREALIGEIPAGVNATSLWDPVRWLVSEDISVMAALFARSDIENLHESALRDGPSETWIERAFLALDHGWQPEQIVYQTRWSDSVWHGEESAIWQAKIDDFENLRADGGSPDARQRERIVDAGVACFEQMRDEAAKRERSRRVFGEPD